MAAQKRTGLGRGIGALIPTDDSDAERPVDVFFPSTKVGEERLVAVPGARLANLSPSDIVPNAAQPRTNFDQDDLDELVASIREVGVLQPIVVRPIAGATPRRASIRADHGRAAAARQQAARPRHHPRHHQEHRR